MARFLLGIFLLYLAAVVADGPDAGTAPVVIVIVAAVICIISGILNRPRYD